MLGPSELRGNSNMVALKCLVIVLSVVQIRSPVLALRDAITYKLSMDLPRSHDLSYSFLQYELRYPRKLCLDQLRGGQDGDIPQMEEMPTLTPAPRLVGTKGCPAEEIISTFSAPALRKDILVLPSNDVH